VRRRWYAQDLAAIEDEAGRNGEAVHLDPTLASPSEAVQ